MKRCKLDSWICEREGIPNLTREILDRLQLERFNELLARQKKRGGFYAGLPERLESLKDLEGLPFTSPEDLSENAGSILLSSQSEVSRVISGGTSGTTGPSKRVFYSEQDLENTVNFFAAGISEMAGSDESVLIAMPFSVSGGLGELISKAVEKIGAKPIKAGSALSYAELEDIMQRERPTSYIGMPVPLLAGLRKCPSSSTLQRALVSADVCPNTVRLEIEKLLGSKLFPHYGLRETCFGAAVTCSAHAGMHVRENHVIPEIVGKGGKTLEDGEYGELVLTTIGMDLMPLIRYRTGDRARIVPGICPCGGVSRRIEVEGRLEDSVRMSDIDNALFDMEEIVDLKAAISDGVLELTVHILNDAGRQEEMRERVSALLPGYKIKVMTEICGGNHKSLYRGKRVIERE